MIRDICCNFIEKLSPAFDVFRLSFRKKNHEDRIRAENSIEIMISHVVGRDFYFQKAVLENDYESVRAMFDSLMGPEKKIYSEVQYLMKKGLYDDAVTFIDDAVSEKCYSCPEIGYDRYNTAIAEAISAMTETSSPDESLQYNEEYLTMDELVEEDIRIMQPLDECFEDLRKSMIKTQETTP